jgi:hypothetical protein
MRREELKKFATLSRVNAEYNYLRQLTLNTIIAKQKCDDQIWMNGRRFLQEITDNKSILQKPNPNFH